MLTRLAAAIARRFSRNQRLLRAAEGVVDEIEAHRATLGGRSDDDLRAAARILRQRRTEGTPLSALRGSAFALVAESCARTTGLELRPAQLIAAAALSNCHIVEMATGEGKTLAALPAAYLAAIDGKGSHVVTVNDYLARRDAAQASEVLGLLGVSVGVVEAGVPRCDRAHAYSCDVTYLTNKQVAADYLRDQLQLDAADQVQRGLASVIVDEADSILIDEARTPLIISGAGLESDGHPERADQVARSLTLRTHFDMLVDERRCSLTEEGFDRVAIELETDLLSEDGLAWLHSIERALTAHHIYRRGREYLVEDDRVVLIDAFTGRKLARRRLRDGLHRALELKERVGGRREQGALASISYQSLFRQYQRLAGMTATAASAAGELHACYAREVLVVPRHQPSSRHDADDLIYPRAQDRWRAVVDAVASAHRSGQPVLVGTATVADSEALSRRLAGVEVPHVVLNARQYAREAEIVARAGEVGAVTIATNMAGRGTDIRLGPGSAERGGLLVIGTVRHDARRIDDQLRGRAGRQGEPGRTQFYVSLDDEIFERHGGPARERWRDRLIGGAIRHDDPGLRAYVSERQQLVERRHIACRKRLLEYDAIKELQRKLVMDVRQQLLVGNGVIDTFHEWLEEESPDQDRLARWRGSLLELRDRSPGDCDQIVRNAMLRAIDTHWRLYLGRAERLRESMRYEGRSGKDPMLLYRRSAFELFDELLRDVRRCAIQAVFETRTSG